MAYKAATMKARIAALAKKTGSLANGLRAATQEIKGLLLHEDEKKRLDPREFSIKALAESFIVDKSISRFMGATIMEEMGPSGRESFAVLEATAGIDSTYFQNIIGQLMYAAVLQGYNRAGVQPIIDLVTDIPSNLNSEIIPGLEGLGDKAEEVKEGEIYPESQFGEDYVETPKTKKFGNIVSVTREAIFFDRTGMIVAHANEIGDYLAVNKAKRILDLIIGADNTFKWKGTSYNTYQTATPWINSISSNEMATDANMDTSNQSLYAMTDPFTGEPITINTDLLLVGPYYDRVARRIFGSPYMQSANNATPVYVQQPNPYYQQRFLMTQYLPARILARGLETVAATAGKYWFRGDFKAAFAYVTNFPVGVQRQAAGSDADFMQDIVYRVKASERGIPAVMDPRKVQKNTG